MKQVYGTLVLLLIGFVVGALAVVANAIPTPQVVEDNAVAALSSALVVAAVVLVFLFRRPQYLPHPRYSALRFQFPWKGVLVSLVFVYFSLAAIHITNGFSTGEGLTMPFEDVRALVTCPNKPSEVWDFVNRPPIPFNFLEVRYGDMGPELYEAVCSGEFRALISALRFPG